MERPKRVYLVWQSGEDQNYYDQYGSLAEAVEQNNKAEIFIARPRCIGRYKTVTKPVRIKRRK